MANPRYAVFVDLENAGGKESMLNNIIEKVKIRGDILLGKVYGYTDQYSNLKECLLSNTFSVVPSLRYGRNQKNNADIQLVIDALEVAYNHELIDCFCIVSGDSDYMPLVGKLKSLGKHVLGISRSEAASGIFIKACNEFIFLESVSAAVKPKLSDTAVDSVPNGNPLDELCQLVITILSDQDGDMLYASELKDTIMRLRPDFNERTYGCATFGKLIARMTEANPSIRAVTEGSSLLVALAEKDVDVQKLTKANWQTVFKAHLKRFKDDGFERINPSILKASIQEAYPDFDEKEIGYKRFSEIMKRLEKDGMVKVEMDDSRSMLLKIC